MFGPDPIDLLDYAPYAPWAYYGHMGIGILALLSAIAAFTAIKGKSRHRISGYVYIASVSFVAITTISLLADNFIAPLMVALCTATYAIGGAWLALQRDGPKVRLGERTLTVFEIAALVVFLTISIPAVRAGLIPPFAPLVILFIPCILLVGDINWFRHPERRRQLRVQRHLARMVWGFVVVLRAPLVELAAAGWPISQATSIFAPILLGLAMLWYFQRRWGGLPFGKGVSRAVRPG